jgi:glycosyltransferase involved in cell wall biosynthesis
MKKILVIDVLDAGCAGSNFFAGGCEMHNYMLCKVLGEMNHEVHVIQTTYGTRTTKECSYDLKNVTQHFLSIPSRNAYVKSLNIEDKAVLKNMKAGWSRKAAQVVKEKIERMAIEFDFCINNYKARFSMMACEMGIPTVQPTHGSTFQYGGMPGTVGNFLGAPDKFDSDIFKFGYISEFVKHDYMSFADKHYDYKITEDYMTYYYVGLSSFKGEVYPEEDYLQVITRCNPDKAPHIALDLAAENGVNLKFFTHIQDQAYYDKKIKKYEGHPNIEILVDQPHDQIMESLRRSRGLVMTAQQETFGIVGLEALERGVPIMYLDNKVGMPPQDSVVAPALKEIIVKSSDHQSLGEKMKSIQFSFKQRENLAQETRKHYSQEMWMKNLNRIFEQMPKKKKIVRSALF